MMGDMDMMMTPGANMGTGSDPTGTGSNATAPMATEAASG